MVLLRGHFLVDQAFGDQAHQIAMHLGRAFVDVGGQRGEAGATAQAGQALEHRHAGLGGLDPLAALAWTRRRLRGGIKGGFGRNGGFAHMGSAIPERTLARRLWL
ncbi:hypothetical protein D3C85_1235260 [compost metagenome]